MLARVTLATLFVAAALALFFLYLQSSEELVLGTPSYVVGDTPLSGVSARAWEVFDAETGEVLSGKDEFEKLPIASVTKLMTAEVALLTLDLSTTTQISWNAVSTEGRAGKLSAGEIIRVRELLFPLLIESSNDAAEAIAEYGDHGTFVTAMNTRAREIGMHDTVFAGPSGLSEENISTADDVRKLLLHLMVDHRHALDITRLEKFIGEDHTWWNNSPVFSSEGFLGGKHGYTDEAGRTLAAVFEQSLRGGVRRPVGIVLLDSEDIERDTSIIREYLSAFVSYTYTF